jgi:alpha-glucosidase
LIRSTAFFKTRTSNLPEVHDVIRAMRELLDAYNERMMVGEIYLPVPDLMRYYGVEGDEAHLPFNFQLIELPWQAGVVRRAVDEYEAALPAGGWPNWVLGNHDQHRLATRIGQLQARVATLLLLTLRGTPTCYYGDEIGMEDGRIPPEMVQDPAATNQPDFADRVGRDPERTPMQWDSSPNAGFAPSGVRPWLPVAADYVKRNVAVQAADPASFLTFFRQLTALRQGSAALILGDYQSEDNTPLDVFAYTRSANDERYLILLNFGSDGYRLDFSHLGATAERRLSTRGSVPGQVELASLELRPDEGVLLRLI